MGKTKTNIGEKTKTRTKTSRRSKAGSGGGSGIGASTQLTRSLLKPIKNSARSGSRSEQPQRSSKASKHELTGTHTRTAMGEIKIFENPKPPELRPLRTPGDRKLERPKAELDVIIFAGGQSFRSVSEDIAIGGLRLRHLIPVEYQNRLLEIVIQDPLVEQGKNFLLMGRTTTSVVRTHTIKFDKLSQAQKDRLDRIIAFLSSKVPSSRR